MSEAERIKRLSYKEKRKKLIYAQIAIMIIIAILTAIFAAIYFKLTEEYYIEYTEHGNVDYKVQLKENDFYEEEWLEDGQAYVASLIKTVLADMEYKMDMGASVDFQYKYSVFANLRIIDNDTNKDILNKYYPIKEEQLINKTNTSKLEIWETIDIDYGTYNELNSQFLEKFKLNDTTSKLVVTMKVEVIGSSEQFESDSQNVSTINLNIPLTKRTVNVNMTSSITESESKILANERDLNQNAFKGMAITTGGLDVILLVIFIFFVYLTRNEDINYSIKVSKIVNSYKSYIQKLVNGFDENGYQILMLDTFADMLTIRDTIQSPILMYENEDQTMTRFFIPTNTKMLYVYEIKVENYDEIYNRIIDDTDVTPIPVKSKNSNVVFLKPKDIKNKRNRNFATMESVENKSTEQSNATSDDDSLVGVN